MRGGIGMINKAIVLFLEYKDVFCGCCGRTVSEEGNLTVY